MTDLESTQKEFDKLLSQLRSTDVESFKTFVLEALEKRSKHADDDDIDSKNALLTKIRNELKKTVNVYAEAPNEKIFYPSTGNFEGHTRKNTVHVDAFLYEDDDVLELQETGKIPINYCLDCQSRNVQPINYISHSVSVDDLAFIFSSECLGRYDLANSAIMDVGSRLGAVLYYAHVFTPTKKLIGVEVNQYFANLQKKTVLKYKMNDRVEVLETDVMKVGKLINEQCDILIMHNVFEFFCSNKDHVAIWKKLKTELLRKKGLKLLCCPPIENSLQDAGITNMPIKDWVKEIPMQHNDLMSIDAERFADFKLYEVK